MTPMNHHRVEWNRRVFRVQSLVARVGIRADGRSPEELQEELDSIRIRQERLNARSQSVLDQADAAQRELTADERRAIQRRTDEVEQLDEQAGTIQALLTRPTPRRTAANASDSPNEGSGRRPGQRTMLTSRGVEPPRRFAEMFAAARDPYGGRFQTLGEFALAVASGNDQRLMVRNSYAGSTTGEGASAGFLVPSAFVQQMMDAALQIEVFRPLANVVPITSGDAIIAGFESTDRTGGKRAGLKLEWGAEAEELVQQKPRARRVQASAKKANVFCVVSSELAEDAPNFDQALTQAMTAAVASGLDYAFLAGNGSGTALGVINSGAAIEVAKESGQTSNTLLLQNLAKMVGRLDPVSFKRSVWYVHPTLIPALYGLSFTVKNVAGTENVGGSYIPAVTTDAEGNLRIFGRPALVTDACSSLSAKGDIVLADPMRYLITMRSDVRLIRDSSRFFDTDEIAFKLTLRLDGMPEDAAPTTLRDGTSTVSPFVVLGAR
ncbi:phage major capsid protein [Roseateles aquatilis]|uniref:Phage major capsid protein n=1 Tax=Roseateles aquatilis TaxID=431061 RepID=A0A246JDV9_9BURK|nr:phage major capsid protein [Roseateles aquatilis]OWQ90823.1 phage major capsid protein [Roseateles aquatilis]